MKEPIFFCLGIVDIHHVMPKVGVVNRLRMRIAHKLVKFPPPLNSPVSAPDKISASTNNQKY